MTNQNTKAMSNKNFFVVLRDSNDTLVSWRAYETFNEGAIAFANVLGYINQCTEGDFTSVSHPGKPKTIVGNVYVDSQGHTLTLERANDDLLRHIVLDTLPTIRDMFDACI